jgi:hypothetical protein
VTIGINQWQRILDLELLFAAQQFSLCHCEGGFPDTCAARQCGEQSPDFGGEIASFLAMTFSY